MKKIICLLLCCVLLLSGTLASAANLDFLTNGALLNYAGTDTITMEFEISSDFLNEITENLGGSEAALYVDIAAILKGIAEQSQTAKVALKVSEDFKRVEMGIEAETVNDIAFNQNIDLTLRTRMGMWLDLDYTNPAQPKCKLIYASPMCTKYVVMDIFESTELIPDLEERENVIDFLGAFCSRDAMQNLLGRSRELIEKYATVSEENLVYTIHFDNEGFCRYLADVINLYVDFFALEGMIEPTEADEIKLQMLTTLPQLKLFGEDGFTMTFYVTKKRTVQKVVTDADFEISLKEIVNTFDDTGMGWGLESDGRISLRVREELKISLGGDAVRVAYPELTAENSITYEELYSVPEQDYEVDDYENAEVFPHYYISVDVPEAIRKDGVYYLPLRATLDAAYEDAYNINYVDGVITITSPWFSAVQIEVGKEFAMVEAELIPVGEVFLYQGNTTYVSQTFFESVFGFTLLSVEHYLQGNAYYYNFWTM